MNNARKPLDNVNVRKAMSKAIDRNAMIRDVGAGVGKPATSMIPPGMPGYQQDLGKDIDFDVNLFADHDSAAFHRGVPIHTEVVAIDCGGGYKAGSRDRTFIHAVFPVRRLPLTQVMNVQNCRPGDAPNRQFAGDLVIAGANLFH